MSDLWMLPLTGDRVPRPLIAGPGFQRDAKLSSDGRWVAYVSDESGQMEVFVATFPDPGRRQPVSSSGGDSPHWSAEGELFFLAADNYLTAVTIESDGNAPVIRKKERLFQPTTADIPSAVFDVSADGKKFVVAAAVDEAGTPSVSVLVNWTAALPP